MTDQDSKREVTIEWHVPESIVNRYATNMVVQGTGEEFIISFFELLPPLLFGSPDDLEKLENLTSVRAECIARVTVSAERMPKFVQALQLQLEKAASK